MISSTNCAGSAKRPCPFDSHEAPEQRLACTPPQEPDVPASVGDYGIAANRTWYDPGITTPHQNDVFASQTVETFHHNVWNDGSVIQSSHPTRDAFQSEDAGYDFTTQSKNAFTGQSVDTFIQTDWGAHTAAQWLYLSQYPSLASVDTAVQLQSSTVFGDAQLVPDNDPRPVQSFDHCNGTVAPWITAAAEQESSYLLDALQTPGAHVGDAELGATPHMANQTLVQTVETAEPTSKNNNGNNVVCFGTICDVSVRLLDDARVLDKSNILSMISDKEDIRNFAIAKRGHYYAIQSKEDVDIAVISAKTTKALQNLDEIRSVTYKAVADVSDLDQCIKIWRNKGKAGDWNLEINIYGPQAARDKVSKLLSSARLYLQQPRCLEGGMSVDNPHMITFPNLTTKSKWAQLPAPLLTPECSSGTSHRDLSEFLKDLDQSGDLQLVDVDSRIATTLLNYQRQGVDFLLQRETAVPGSAFSLWEDVRIGKFDKRYHHKITGQRTSKPVDEMCGGILADEMGLGKTLMMLSTILATLSQSRAFCENRGAAGNFEKRLSRATLVIAPSALLLDGWMAEVRKHVGSDTLRIQKYHGSCKETDIEKLVDFEVVLTTYATIAAESTRNSRLHGITWFRIVLDEAHSIRNQSTKCFRAVASLYSKNRWCLTGTPIQNKLEDLGALVRFLRVPFLDTPSAFRNRFVRPIEAGSSPGFGNLRTLLKCICIRRTRDLLQLPEPRTLDYKFYFSAVEQSRYSHICESYRQAIDDVTCGRQPSEAYRTILQALLKLRILCNHGSLLSYDTTSVADGPNETLAFLQGGSASCVYCGGDVICDGAEEDFLGSRLPACSHPVCGGCIQQYQEDLQRLSEGCEVACPLCKVSLKEDLVVSGKRAIADGSQISLSETGMSTKLSKLLEDIKEHRFSDKCIIFSVWKKTLYIISTLLSKQSLPFVQLDGSLSLSDRREVLSRFEQDTQTNVLLMTLGTGAVGLNLTVASRIHIVEPQWNPSVESQAIGRAVRLGQEKQVTIIRYVVLNTVEQHIRSRQSRKLQIAELGFDAGGEDSENVKLKKLKDLRQLLGI